jgi:hypothetical protein
VNTRLHQQSINAHIGEQSTKAGDNKLHHLVAQIFVFKKTHGLCHEKLKRLAHANALHRFDFTIKTRTPACGKGEKGAKKSTQLGEYTCKINPQINTVHLTFGLQGLFRGLWASGLGSEPLVRMP